MVPAVTSHADVCGVLIISSSSSSLFLSETKIDRSYPNLGGGGRGGRGGYSVTPHM